MADKSTSTPPGQANEIQEDVVIALMGMTGSGKSSFIKLLTGDDHVVIGDNIVSETNDVQPYHLFDQISGRKVVIVDTPGFDDSRCGVTDTEILRKIAKFLVNEYDMNRKLNGLIYFQRISDPRFGGQAQRNLRMFRNLCGTEAYPNVVVLTTFWDSVVEEVGNKRQEQLYSEPAAFKDLVEGGARFMRHDRTRKSALEVVGRIFTFTPTNPRIVEEIRMEGKLLEETEAGSVRRGELDRIIVQLKEEVEELKEMVNSHWDNETMRKQFEEEEEDSAKQLLRWETERAELKKDLGDVNWGKVAVVGCGVCLLAAGGMVLVPAGLSLAGFGAATAVAPSAVALFSAGTSAATGSVLIGAAMTADDDKAEDEDEGNSDGSPSAAPGTGSSKDGSG